MSINSAKEERSPFIAKKEEKHKDQPEKIGFDLDFLRRLYRLAFVFLGNRRIKQILVILFSIATAFGVAFFRMLVADSLGSVVQHLIKSEFFEATMVLLEIISMNMIVIALLTIQRFCVQFLGWLWRKNITFYLLKHYFAKRNYYTLLNFHGNMAIDNPDQRIQADAKVMCTSLAECSRRIRMRVIIDIVTLELESTVNQWHSLRVTMQNSKTLNRCLTVLYLA